MLPIWKSHINIKKKEEKNYCTISKRLKNKIDFRTKIESTYWNPFHKPRINIHYLNFYPVICYKNFILILNFKSNAWLNLICEINSISQGPWWQGVNKWTNNPPMYHPRDYCKSINFHDQSSVKDNSIY